MDGDASASGNTSTSESRPRSPLPLSASSPTHSSRNPSGEGKANNSHREILILREELCKLVADLSVTLPDSTKVETVSQNTISQLEKVTSTLQPFFDSIASSTEENSSYDIDDSHRDEIFRGITPLVLACDRGNLACVLYFCQLLERQASSSTLGSNFWELLIGCPLKSRTGPNKTTVFHHCTTELAIQAEQNHKVKGESFLELLERIAIAQQKLRGGDESRYNKIDNNLILALGEAVNSHGDTPLMMAAANGISLEDSNGNSSAKAFLEHWHMLAIERCHPECLQLQTESIQKTLTAKNNDGRSVLSYAWLGGIVDLIQWLIDIDDRSNSSSIPIITSEDTLQFRKSLGLIGKRIQNDKVSTNGYEKKQIATEECTKRLEAHVKKRSELVAQQLLQELEGDDKNSQKPTRKRKKKKKKQHPQQEHALELVENVSGNGPSADQGISDTVEKDVLHLTKLTNGKLAVTVPGQQEKQEEYDDTKNPTALPSAWYRKRTFSLDETNQLLRDRYKEGSTNSASIAKEPKSICTTPKAPNESSDADSVLSALCLDVNCLLYSDHGMALNLSPAQLDAVEQILREQLQSVAKARLLQERRYKSATESSSLVSYTTRGERHEPVTI